MTFKLLTSQYIPELNTQARLYRHVQTGAELLSLENDDENKVFGITFRTPPPDSSGVAHIMEHAVLCGSRKYPVKEPFVELLKGSLNTFVNAMTYPDKTTYPLASPNLQDFYNLIDVYLDAVFYPRIEPQTLQQEGWHFELDRPEDPLVFKGVVFNEMKGNYSSPDDVLDSWSQRLLFPEHPYGYDSGGDPAEIPNLTYEQFIAFHQSYYHPANARAYFWGNDDPETRLRRLDEYFEEFGPLEVHSEIPLAHPFGEPHRHVLPYDAGDDPEGKKAFVAQSWLLPETTNPELTLNLRMLGHILVATSASPLRKALIDSGLGEDLTGRGLDEGLRQMLFATGLKGVALANTDRVEPLIFDTLRTLARDGLDPDTVAASVNTVEFYLRENNTGRLPRGLAVMLRAVNSWLYGGDPIAALAFEAPLKALKTRLAAGERVFETLIERYLLSNPHRVTVTLVPDPEEGKRRETVERERLAEARAKMSAFDIEVVIENTRALKQRQETPDTPEALATIPRLKLADLEPKIKTVPLEAISDGGPNPQILYHDLFTNGIVYLDLGLNLHTLPQECLPYVTLFGRALLETGTATEDFVRLSQRIGQKTGGIRPTPLLTAVREQTTGAAWLFLRGKATVPQTGELLALLQDVLASARLDNRARIRQIVLEEKADHEAGLIPAGHIVVNTRLRARFNEADWAAEQIGGVSYLFFLRQLAEQIDQDWPAVQAQLERIRRILVDRRTMLANVTIDAANWARVHPQLANFLAGLPAGEAVLADWQPVVGELAEGLTIPAQVNYVAKGANLYHLGYKLHGSMVVISNYVRTTWLWERVRVQGGAYGGFCAFDPRSGVFTYLSYRDPNLLATLDNYDGTAGFLRKLEISPDELTKSIIGAIGELDAYLLPDARGYSSMVRWLTGDTDARRQQYRDEVMGTTAADFRALGEVLERLNDTGQVIVLGSAEAIEKAKAERSGWMEVKKVL